jgi:hypothetical protein
MRHRVLAQRQERPEVLQRLLTEKEIEMTQPRKPCPVTNPLVQVAREIAEQALTDARFVGSGELEYAIAAALIAARREAIEECAKVAEEYWKSGKNVYARHAGRAVETRILAKLGVKV